MSKPMKIPLPDFKSFKSRKKEPSPYIAFYNWVMLQLFPMGESLYTEGSTNLLEAVAERYKKSLDVTKIGLHSSDDKLLRAMQEEWYVKKQKFTKERAKKAVMWEHFDIGPRTCDDQDPGFVYIEKDYLIPVRK